MASQPTIQFTFTNKYPARFSGEPGLYSKTILEFEDRDGKMAPLAEKLIELQHAQIDALGRVIGGKNPIHRFKLRLTEGRRGYRIFCLKGRTRQLMIRMLRENAYGARMRIASETISNGFRPLEAYQAHEIANRLETAKDHWVALYS